MRLPKPVARFRLYPDSPHGLYVLVTVWPTLAAMREDARRRGYRRSHAGVLGFASGITIIDYRKRKARKASICAEVNLAKARLGTEIITHELFHATCAWGRRVRFPFATLGDEDRAVSADEERITHAHGRLCSQFVARAYAAGLYE